MRRRRFDASLARYERAAVRSQVTLNMLNLGQAAIISVGLALIMLMAADGVKAGTMTVGKFVLVNTYLMQLYQPLNFLGFVYREIKQGLVDMEQMFRLLSVHQEVADRPGRDRAAAASRRRRGGRDPVRRTCSFGYTPAREILKGVSFTVPAGHKLAIVGPTGAGKSTISRLLFRFYDVTGGRILLDGHDMRDLTQDSLRAAIGVVPQDTVLFNDTIRYNIAYGRPGATQEEIEHAARLAQVHDFVLRLPEGYDTRVGERGLKLSGGEKQRVAIARTILKDPRILILDEATSALDTRTEQDIQTALRAVAARRTTLVIAHRLSTVVDADEILVLVDGRMAERGTHRELLARNGSMRACGRCRPSSRMPRASRMMPKASRQRPCSPNERRVAAAAARGGGAARARSAQIARPALSHGRQPHRPDRARGGRSRRAARHRGRARARRPHARAARDRGSRCHGGRDRPARRCGDAGAARRPIPAGSSVREGDAVGLELAALVPEPRQVVANLPYNVATPLLVGWLRSAEAFERLTLMFQLEVAERICAAPDTPAYGRLAVLVAMGVRDVVAAARSAHGLHAAAEGVVGRGRLGAAGRAAAARRCSRRWSG